MQKYLIRTDTNHLLCIDERPRIEHIQGIHIPGAIYGVIDALKVISKITEDEAWEKVVCAGIPTDAHTDDHHHDDEAMGCGYATLQKTPASERFERAKAAGGMVLHYTGGHNPKHAIIVYHKGMTVDQKATWRDGEASFVFDYWAALDLGSKLGVDPKLFANQLEKKFRQTVTTLSEITKFIQLAPTNTL